MAEHWAYVAWDGDHIGREVERAGLADEPDRLRQLSQAIEAGNETWRSWALSHGGDVISVGGDEGNCRVPADYLGEVADLREKYGKVVGASVSVGIGGRLSEAGRALMAAKLQGGDRITLYEPEVDDILAQAKQKTEEQKISEAYLNKAGEQPSLNAPDQGGGMTGPHQAPPSAPTAPSEPGGDDKPPEEGAVPASASPVQGADIHDQLSGAADDQGQKDQDQQDARQSQSDAASGAGDMKKQVLKILKVFQDRKDELEQLKQQDPELYQSLVGMVQVLIAGARQLFGGSDTSDGTEDKAPDTSDKKDVKKSEFAKGWPTKKTKPGDCKHFYGRHNKCLRCGNVKTEKAALEAGTTGRHDLELPVGSQKDAGPEAARDVGRIKVQDPSTGASKWRQVRAGLVMDPQGLPTSSRHPGG